MPRKGSKRSDRRWIDPGGQEWDSKFEWLVYERLRSDGYRVRRCDESDSIAYHSGVRQGRCLECGSAQVVQERIYTPDLFVVGRVGSDEQCRSAIECKGYFPGSKRNLFRSVAKQWGREWDEAEGPDLRIVFESNRLRGTALSSVEYVHKYAKNVTPGLAVFQGRGKERKLVEIEWQPRSS
jgi:hypothetical protein